MPRLPATERKTPASSATTRLGDRLRQLRVSANMTQTDLAGDRFSKEYVSQIERGKTRPARETIEWLAERLGGGAGFPANGVTPHQRRRVEAAPARPAAPPEAGRGPEAVAAFEDAPPAGPAARPPPP